MTETKVTFWLMAGVFAVLAWMFIDKDVAIWMWNFKWVWCCAV